MDTNAGSENAASNQAQHYGLDGPKVDLYPAALRAIEEDNLDRMETLIKLENFNKDSLDNLVSKVCERSRDIEIEENFVKHSSYISNCDEQESMLSIYQTARKNNKRMLDLLVEAESRADLVPPPATDSKHRPTTCTPTKPKLASMEKSQLVTSTPELPKFKTNVCRELKF